MTPPSPAKEGAEDDFLFDPLAPLRGVVVCCTSIPPEQRTDIANKVAELGGVHKYDLTPDCTHLLVGKYDTPKYRHVARERPDVLAMDASWIEAISSHWRDDDEINFPLLEERYRLKALETCGADLNGPGGQPIPRQSLLVCLTGFADQRNAIAETVQKNGGHHTGDLTRRCTHLIVSKPEGKKFTAAKAWGVHTVTLDWLLQSVARDMILEETKFDPLLPEESQGVGAWIKKDPKMMSRGKRARPKDGEGLEEGGRKLRKTASMKLNSQRDHLWQNILGQGTTTGQSVSKNSRLEEPTQVASPRWDTAMVEEQTGPLSHCTFAIHGFNQQRQQILHEAIVTMCGVVVYSAEWLTAHVRPTEQRHCMLIVPQNSQPETHPQIPDNNIHVVTEFYIEKCMQEKRFCHPDEHVLGRPFPAFPIAGFSDLIVCSAAFKGLELHQVSQSIAQLGANYQEEFRQSTSVVVCKSLRDMRKEKSQYAAFWGVPVVSADWLWECISTGFKIPFDDYEFPELRHERAAALKQRAQKSTEDSQPTDPSNSKGPEPTVRFSLSRSHTSRSAPATGVDASDFDRKAPNKAADKRPLRPPDNNRLVTSADFDTSRSQTISRPQGKRREVPLRGLSHAHLNKSPSPTKQVTTPTRTHSAPSNDTTSNLQSPSKLRGPSAPPAPLPKDRPPRDSSRRATTRQADEQARAAEREALSSRLQSLIQAPDVDGASGGIDITSAAPPPRRRRRVLGRATSNISNASSAASADATTSGGGGGGGGLSESWRRLAPHDEDDDEHEQATPPATQLEYRDQQAEACKRAMMHRMLSGSSGAHGTRSRAEAAAAQQQQQQQ